MNLPSLPLYLFLIFLSLSLSLPQHSLYAALSGWEWDERGIDSGVAVTQATGYCSVVTVMRTGSADTDRLNDRGTQERGEKGKEAAIQMLEIKKLGSHRQ